LQKRKRKGKKNVAKSQQNDFVFSLQKSHSFFFFLPFSFVLSSFEILFEQLFLSIKNNF